MAKSTRGDFLRCAEQALAQQNFPMVYKNAAAALAMGAPQSTYFLCAFYRHQIEGVVRAGAGHGSVEIGVNFGTMYELAAYYQVGWCKEFTPFYTRFSSNAQPIVKTSIMARVEGYKGYIQTAQAQCHEGTAVDLGTADRMVSLMEGSVQQVIHQVVQSLRVDAQPKAPHGYHSLDDHHPKEVVLAGEHKHSSDSKCCCAIS